MNRLKQAIAKVFGRRTDWPKPCSDVYPETEAEILEILKCSRTARGIRFWLTPDMLYMHGAFCYGRGWHPFVDALAKGKGRLESFYGSFCPKSINEMFFLPNESRCGDVLPPWQIVWLEKKHVAPPIPEMGLGIEHGVSYYGPASIRKIDVEMERLESTLASIDRYGYKPDDHGDINGVFLHKGGVLRFFVRGGKHRAAVLSYLGFHKIPVIIRPDWEPLIEQHTANSWFLVRSGAVSVGLAKKIFGRYFEFNGTEQRSLMCAKQL